MKKIKYIFLGYTFCIIWAFIAEAIIGYLGYPYPEGEGIVVTPAWLIFYACIFAPIWEEALYRYGPITIAKNMGREYILPVVIMSSIIFGWQHYQNPESVLLQGMLGLFFSFTYIKAGYSYLSSVIVHSLYNLTILILENHGF